MTVVVIPRCAEGGLGHLDVGSLLAKLLGALGGVHADWVARPGVVGRYLAGKVDPIALLPPLP